MERRKAFEGVQSNQQPEAMWMASCSCCVVVVVVLRVMGKGLLLLLL